MSKNQITLFVFFCCFTITGYTQACDSTLWAQPGTYEVVIDTNAFESGDPYSNPIMLSGEDLCFIEANRKPYVNVQIHIGIYLITIYPKIEENPHTVDE